jgi:hypothetical protein
MNQRALLLEGCRPIADLRCTHPGCERWLRNVPGGEFASCSELHGKLHQRLSSLEEAYCIRENLPRVVRAQDQTGVWCYSIPGLNGLWNLGDEVEPDELLHIARLVKRRRILAKLGDKIFRMRSLTVSATEPPTPVQAPQSQQTLPLVFEEEPAAA